MMSRGRDGNGLESGLSPGLYLSDLLCSPLTPCETWGGFLDPHPWGSQFRVPVSVSGSPAGPLWPIGSVSSGPFPIPDASPLAQRTWHSDWQRLGSVFHHKPYLLEPHLEPRGVEPKPVLTAVS